MLDYAEKLTRTPSAMSDADVESLRAQGLSDETVLRVAEITAYFNFVNRMAEGLGVRIEPGIQREA